MYTVIPYQGPMSITHAHVVHASCVRRSTVADGGERLSSAHGTRLQNVTPPGCCLYSYISLLAIIHANCECIGATFTACRGE